MKYHPQSPNACLAYSAFNLGAVDMDAVQEYEKLIRGHPTVWLQTQWAKIYAPWMVEPMLEPVSTWAGKPWQMIPKIELPKGQGVLGVFQVDETYGLFLGMHALAYKSGTVMDSSNSAPGRVETWEEMTARLLAEEGTTIYPVSFAPFKRRRTYERQSA